MQIPIQRKRDDIIEEIKRKFLDLNYFLSVPFCMGFEEYLLNIEF